MRKYKWMLFILIALTLVQLWYIPFASSTNASSITDDWAMFRHTPNHSGVSNGNNTTNSAKLLWNYTTNGAILSSPAVACGCVFVGSKDGYIYCFNASKGQLVWNFQTGEEVDSSPAIDSDRVYVGSDDGWLYCLNITTGMPFWIKWVGWNGGFTVRSSPVVTDGRVYVGSGNHDVYCFNESDGSILWTYKTLSPVMSSPAVLNGKLYIATGDNCFYAINASTGDEIWNTSIGSGVSSPCVNDGCVYVGSYEGNVFCLNASNGARVWGFQTGDTITSSPAIANGCVYVGSEDNSVYCINASNAQEIWQTKTGYWVCSSPTIADGNLYVGSEDYNIYSFNAQTGAIQWSYQTGNYVDSSPTIVNDTLYIGSYDHCLYAFSLCNSTNATVSSVPSDQLAWTIIMFDVIAIAPGVILVFAVVRFVQSTHKRKNAIQMNKFSIIKFSWLSSHAEALCLLGILIFSASYFINLGGNFLWAADEQTYSQMAVHMVKTGDYLTPTAFGEIAIWAGKPPLLMWLTSLSYQVFGITNFASRFCVPIFGTLALVTVFYLGKKLYNTSVGFLSAIVLGTFTTFSTFATHAMTDVPLIFFILTSLYFMLSSEDKRNTNLYAALSGLCFGLALMTKQTEALLIPVIVITYLILTNRNIRFLITKTFALFLGVALLVFAPWLIYMSFHFGTSFLDSYFLYSTYARAISPVEGHVGSYLYYFNYLVTSENLLWIVFLPFAVGLSAYLAIKRSKGGILVITWIVIVLLVFTVAQTKIYYYILPAFPAFAIAISALICQVSHKTWHFLRSKNLHVKQSWANP